MVSLPSSRPTSSSSSSSQQSLKYPVSTSVAAATPTASSSQESLNDDDEGEKHCLGHRLYQFRTVGAENVTITGNRVMLKRAGKQKSSECVPALPVLRIIVSFHANFTRDIRLLAISTHMTELSYNISDIQTRIFGRFGYIPTTPRF
jgi:hypothetical protein